MSSRLKNPLSIRYVALRALIQIQSIQTSSEADLSFGKASWLEGGLRYKKKTLFKD